MVDDEPRVREVVVAYLEREGFRVSDVSSVEAARAVIEETAPDLVVLDIMLPAESGLDLLADLRRRGEVPVILLTSRSEETDRVLGLELGADDYVTKPFSVSELLARVRAHLRRSDEDGPLPDRVEIGSAVVDFTKYIVYKGDEQHDLTDREVAMLRLMIEHPHEVITRDRLLDEVWGLNAYPTTRTIDTFVYRLRQKLEDDTQNPRHLLTVRGAGYKYIP